jgi:biopolymer transport protein ExbD/biopolymer transport protein TolR
LKRRLGLTESDGVDVRAEINVTSLVDVAFTLLIIFMITAPILQGGIEIDVPEAPSGPISASDPLVVSIDEDGQIYLDDAPVTLDEFEAAIGPLLEQRDTDEVFVQADANLSYSLVLRVVGRITEAGAESVSLVAEPELRR